MKSKGFTLIELIIVVAIILILVCVIAGALGFNLGGVPSNQFGC